MKPSEIARVVSLCFPDIGDTINSQNVQSQNLQRLWAGMGHIYRVNVDGKDMVIKHIQPPRKLSSLGDQRKADSYLVEANFYEQVAPRLQPLVPKPLYVERKPHNEIIICMSFIPPASYYSHRMSEKDHHKAVLSWLAQFHAAHWGEVDQVVKDVGLQPIGSYWYLDTRPDEHKAMSNKGWEGRLKLAARALDIRLQQDPYQCLIHGDAKDANVIPLEHGKVVMVDFQYCGKGPPTKDLAYFLCTEVDTPAMEEEYLKYYLEQLQNHLSKEKHSTIPSLEELQESLDLAYCDFCRFLCGWGHWGGDLRHKVIPLLDRLDGGTKLDSEQAYIDAMEREFGV